MPKYDKDQLLADWRAGGYTQQELADKHGTSRSNVSKLVNGIDKDLAAIVAKRIAVEQDITGLSGKEMDSVNEQTIQAIEAGKIIQVLTRNNLDGVAVKLQNHDELSMLDHKNAQDLIDKASITLGVNARHAQAANIQQNNQAVTELVITRAVAIAGG